MPKIRDRAPLSKLKKKKKRKKKAIPAEIRTRGHRRQSPYTMNHATIAYQSIKFTRYKVLP